MSANRDKTQKIAFVYSNLYQIYKKGKEAAKAAPDVIASELHEEPAPAPSGLRTSNVLKVEDLSSPTFGIVKVNPYRPVELLQKRVAKVAKASTAVIKPAAAPAVEEPILDDETDADPSIAPNPAIESLKQNLRNLNDLHARLRFMLQELETLIHEDEPKPESDEE